MLAMLILKVINIILIEDNNFTKADKKRYKPIIKMKIID